MAKDIFEITPLEIKNTTNRKTKKRKPNKKPVVEPVVDLVLEQTYKLPTIESNPATRQFLKDIAVKLKRLKLWVWVTVVIIGFSVFSLYGGQKNIMGVLTVGFYKNPEKTAQKEMIKLLTDVSELIVLPADEVPVIATVTDPAKLTNQTFFTKAKVGDRVLLYPNNRKAILYSPKDRKIIEVAPLNTRTQN